MEDLGVGRKTAAKYLDALVDLRLLEKHKIKNINLYVNKRLLDKFK
jgi:predicted AAA+ superfamily ATPase